MALDLDKIRTAAERVAHSHGLDVVEVGYRMETKPRTLCIYVEKNAEERGKLAAAGNADALRLAGVTHEDCTAFSRDFGTLADVEDLVPGAPYTLEVSSPGLDRKLKTPADFERFRGSLVKVETFEPVGGSRRWQGRLETANESAITLEPDAGKQKNTGRGRKALKKPPEKTTSAVKITLGNIERARLIPEF